MNFSIKKVIVLVSIALIFAAIILSSCEMKIEKMDAYIPEPANQFAVDKQTETSKIEETKAHHVYKEIDLPAKSEIVIGNTEFLTKINHIKNHIDDYKDSVVVIEGMYGLYTSWDKTFELPMVYRNGPGCCGDDQYDGFFLVNIDQSQYEIDDWIRVSGVPYMYDHVDSEGEVQKFPYILTQNIEVLPLKDRKAEMVND